MADFDYRTILVERKGAVDWLTLNRPDSLNALSVEMVRELNDYFDRAYNDPVARVIVMKAAGRAFCAGLDLDEVRRAAPNPPETPFAGGFLQQSYMADVYIKMRRCPQPIITLVQGAACGGGFAFVLASDIRIAGESARMNAAFIKLGLSACDMGVSYFLPRLVGVSLASELMLTGRFIHADRALRSGLVSEVVPDSELEAAAQPYIDEMLETTAIGLRLTKEGLNYAIDAPSLQAAMAIENRNQFLAGNSDEFRNMVRDRFEKGKK